MPFLPADSRGFFVALRVCKIDRFVRNVVVPAENYVPTLRDQAAALVENCSAEIKLVGEPFTFRLAVGKVVVDKCKVLILHNNAPSLCIKLFYSEITYGHRFLFRVNSYTAVSLLFGTEKVGQIPLLLKEFLCKLFLLSLCFLNAQHIGFLPVQKIKETLLFSGSYTVYVP